MCPAMHNRKPGALKDNLYPLRYVFAMLSLGRGSRALVHTSTTKEGLRVPSRVGAIEKPNKAWSIYFLL